MSVSITKLLHTDIMKAHKYLHKENLQQMAQQLSLQ